MAVAFLSIVALLAISGTISFLELRSLSREMGELSEAAHARWDTLSHIETGISKEGTDTLSQTSYDVPVIAEGYPSREDLSIRIDALNLSAHRSIAPVLISLAVMIAALLLLYYFTVIYCVRPVVAMNRALERHLEFKIPFVVKTELKDEMAGLKEGIDDLIASKRRPVANGAAPAHVPSGHGASAPATATTPAKKKS